jgi:hypothetical protein
VFSGMPAHARLGASQPGRRFAAASRVLPDGESGTGDAGDGGDLAVGSSPDAVVGAELVGVGGVVVVAAAGEPQGSPVAFLAGGRVVDDELAGGRSGVGVDLTAGAADDGEQPVQAPPRREIRTGS